MKGFVFLLAFTLIIGYSHSEPSLNTIISGCQYLASGDIPSDSFAPPLTAIHVNNYGARMLGYGIMSSPAIFVIKTGVPGSITNPYEFLEDAIVSANAHPETPLTIYIHSGEYSYKNSNHYLSIQRGNLYIASYPGDQVVIRPYYWPANPTDWGDERCFVLVGSFLNVTFDHLNIEGFSTCFHIQSPVETPPIKNIAVKNCMAGSFTRRAGVAEFGTAFLVTGIINSDVYGAGKQIFSDPDNAHYQVEGLTVSNCTIQNVDTGVGFGDENDANVKGFRISHLNVTDTITPLGYSDGIAMVNSYKGLIDHCKIKGLGQDGIDAKAYNVSVVNCWIERTGRNAVKFWRNGELINSILYNVTAINDGAIVVEDGPFRMINSVLLHHTVGYAGTLANVGVRTNMMLIVNSVYGEIKSILNMSTNFQSKNCRWFSLLEGAPLMSGSFTAATAADLNAQTNCSGNAVGTNQFVSPSNGNFSLVAGSPWINAGMSVGIKMPSFDYYGNPRIQGGAVDIGPIESAGADPTPTPMPTPTPTPKPRKKLKLEINTPMEIETTQGTDTVTIKAY